MSTDGSFLASAEGNDRSLRSYEGRSCSFSMWLYSGDARQGRTAVAFLYPERSRTYALKNSTTQYAVQLFRCRPLHRLVDMLVHIRRYLRAGMTQPLANHL